MRKGAFLFVIFAVVFLGGCNLFTPPGPKLLYEERCSQAEENTWFQGVGKDIAGGSPTASTTTGANLRNGEW